MKYLHGPFGYQTVWIVVPFVCLLIWLFNSYRMGKFSSFLKFHLGKSFWIVAGIILVLVPTVFLMIPRAFGMKEIDISEIDEYPELERELTEYQEKYDNIYPAGKFYRITVGNYFSQDTALVLPCYEAVFRTVPQHGDTKFSSKIVLLTAGEEIGELCLRDFSVEIVVGDETFVSSKAEMDHGLYSVNDNFYRYAVPKLEVLAGVRYGVDWNIGTSGTADEENELAEGSFLWNYKLFVYGKEISTVVDEQIFGEYILNAT